MSDEVEHGHDASAADAAVETPDRRALTIRVLYSWLNLTLLYLMLCPLLIVVFGAPQDQPADLPWAWLPVYLVAPVGAIALSIRLWRLNELPTDAAHPTAALKLLRLGGWRGQVVYIVLGVTITTAAMLLILAPEAGAKTLLSGLARALALQLLVAGYVKSMLDRLGADPSRSYWFGVGMFAFTFAVDTAVNAAVRQNIGLDVLPIAFAAGALLGLLVGLVSMSLRGRTGSIWPAVMLQLLLLTIVPAFLDD